MTTLSGTTGYTSANGLNLRGKAIASKKITHNTTNNTLALSGKLSFNAGNSTTQDMWEYRAAAMRFFWDNRASFIKGPGGTYPGDRNTPAYTTNSFRNVGTITFSPTYSNSALTNNYHDAIFDGGGFNFDGRGTLLSFGGAPGITGGSVSVTPSNAGDGSTNYDITGLGMIAFTKTAFTGQPEITGSTWSFNRTNNNNDGFACQILLPYGRTGVTTVTNPVGNVVYYTHSIAPGGCALLMAYDAGGSGVSHNAISTSLSDPGVVDMSFQAAPASRFYFQLVVNLTAQYRNAVWLSGDTDVYGNFSAKRFPFTMQHIIVNFQ